MVTNLKIVKLSIPSGRDRVRKKEKKEKKGLNIPRKTGYCDRN